MGYWFMFVYFPSDYQKIYGIAVTAPDESIANNISAPIGMYILHGGLPVLVDTVLITQNCNRCYFLYEGAYPAGTYTSGAVPCYEFLFEECDNPSHIMKPGDTILLGLVDTMRFSLIPPYNTIRGLRINCNQDHGGRQVLYDRVNERLITGFDGTIFSQMIWGGMFPMLAPDRPQPCPKLDVPVVAEHGEDWVTLSWNGDGCDTFELILTMTMDTSIFLTDTHYTLTDLAPGGYFASVRGICHHVCCLHDTVLYGHPSNRTYFQATIGINEAEAAGLGVAVLPNPASTHATVTAKAGVTLVEAYDEKGTMTARIPADGSTQATIDTKDWPTGTYLLRIHTPQGTAVKKLVVRK